MKTFLLLLITISTLSGIAQSTGTCTYIPTSSTINTITSASGGTYTVTYTAGNDSSISNVGWPSTITVTFSLGPIVPTDAVSGAVFTYNNYSGADNSSNGQNDFSLGTDNLYGQVPIQDYVNIQFSGNMVKNMNFTNSAIDQTDFDNDVWNNTVSLFSPSITGTYPGTLTTPTYVIPTGINSSGLLPTNSFFANSGEYAVYGPSSLPTLSNPNFTYSTDTAFGWNHYNVGSGETNILINSIYYIVTFGKVPSFDRIGNSYMSNGYINNPYPWYQLLGAGDQSLAELSYGFAYTGVYSDNGVINSIVYSPFTLNYTSIVLPVSYMSFTCTPIGKTSELNWTVAQETNDKGFEIERSTDLGKTWISIGFQPTKANNGTSNSAIEYTYNDSDPNEGLNEYRLKQINLSGSFSYSEIASDNFDNNNSVRIFPNPAFQTLNIENNFASDPQVNYSIFDAKGSLVQSGQQYFVFGQTNTLNISNLSKGFYVLQLIGTSGKIANLPFLKK